MDTQSKALWALFLLTITLMACATLPGGKPQAPTVTVERVRPLNLSLTGQKLEFSLRVENPNAFDLPLEGLNFVAKLGGEKIADGISNELVIVPAKADAIVHVEVTAGISKMINRIRSMLEGDEVDLDYDVTGTVKLASWPTAIPFNVDGELENPTQ
ncbi:MAG: LEA type 2 family protein [Gammaproteobacteria bacterium]|nr:LEA type 2 family protein [Gammaproteobacteria bacterium]